MADSVIITANVVSGSSVSTNVTESTSVTSNVVTGGSGPGAVSTSTETSISGLIKGASGNLAQAVASTDYTVPADLQTIIGPGAVPIYVTGLNYRNITTVNAGSGDVVIYTVPTGKQAMISAFTAFNSAGTTTTILPQLYISGAYYLASASFTLATITGLANNASRFFQVLSEGEKFAVNTSQAGVTFFNQLMEWDANTSIKRAQNLALSTGNNTILTCPANKTILLNANNSIHMGTSMSGTAQYANSSGSNKTVNWFYVPSGQSANINTQHTTSAVVANNAIQSYAGPGAMNEGDSLVVTTNDGTGTQTAIVSYYEYDS